MSNATKSARLSPGHLLPNSNQGRSKALPKYLHKRGACFYFKRKIPSDVIEGFPQYRGQIWKALGTELLEKARLLLAVEVTEFELSVAKLRKQKAQLNVGEHVPFGVAGNPGNLGNTADTMRVPGAESLHGVLEGKMPSTLFKLASTHAEQSSLLPYAKAERSELVHGRQPVAIQIPGPNQAAKKLPTLLHLFEFWKVGQTRPRTIQTVKNTVLEFHGLCGSMAAESICRQHARAYRDQLIEKHLADGTIENRLGFLSTLFRFGQIELIEHVPGNPFERIPVNGGMSLRAEKDRRAYNVGELNKLFSSRLYTRGYRPKGQAVDAAYWAPLLGPFVGGRIEEIAQLRIEDIERINQVWCIRICNLDDEQKIKNPGSYRRVPLHETVIRCGFLAYVASQALAGYDRVFPSLSNENANAVWSNALGKWFGRYLDSVGLNAPRLDYHSFRYTFRQQCSLSGIGNEVRDALTGHWITNKDSGRTYMRAEERQYPFPSLWAAIQQLRYEELRMSHLFVANPMQDVDKALLR
jgi:integrase